MDDLTERCGEAARRAADAAQWTNSRCIELDRFRTLLREIKALNNGTGFLQRTERCIEIAELLDRFDLGGDESFLRFLERICIASRTEATKGASETPTKTLRPNRQEPV